MDVRQAVKNALNFKVGQEEEEEVGEIQVAEYVIFLLALDTYIRYVEEATNTEDPEDQVIHRALRILRLIESELDQLKTFLESHLPSDSHKRMLAKALRIRVTSSQGAALRALQLRTILNRGGASTMRAVFETNKALRQVRDAMAASVLDDADKALDQFAAMPLRNQRIRQWIDLAAQTAGSGELPQNPVEAGSKEASDQASVLLNQQVQGLAASSAEETKEASEAQAEKMVTVQNDATNAAKKALDQSGEPDELLTRSEVVGVAVAAAVAATADPSKPQNIPDPLRKLDDEQRAAALTDGRVGVFAGAGSGKSSTLVARVAYLVKERRVNPSRILVTSFNQKAAEELKEKLGKAVGGEALQQMSVGTMHSLFRRAIMEYGSPGEKRMMERPAFVGDGKSIAYSVQKVWEDCYGKDHPPPKLKSALSYMARWSGNDVSPAQALSNARNDEEEDAAHWYELYQGLKGTLPGWKPPCQSKAIESFMGRLRPRGEPLGDYTDMLKIYRDILKRNPAVRAAVQKVYDHIIVDEAQDRNTLMADIIDMMSEHVTDGNDGKSVWIVGDDKQAINQFQGAKASIFRELYQKEGWKTRVIRTNYRCEPEIVDAANKLIANNEGNIPIPQVPSPARVRGTGSIVVSTPADEADAALSVIEEIKQNQALGAELTDHAVLCRTNKELHSYETACIIRGIPYARRGSASFFGSPETKAVLGYVQLVTGANFKKGQLALGDVINKPNRFFLTDAKKVPDAVKDAFMAYARRQGMDVSSIDPMAALGDRYFVRILADNLARLTRTGKGFKFEEKIEDLAAALTEMRAKTSDADYKTKDLFDDILGLPGTAIVEGKFVEQTFRESIQVDLRNALGEDDAVEGEDEDDDSDPATKGLGNVSFLYALAKIDPTDEDDALNPPTTPNGFAAKMSRYAAKMQDLRTDIDKWYQEQRKVAPEQRRPPPGVYIGTVHSTKGAQWPTTFVQMPNGKFPLTKPQKPGAPPPDPEDEKDHIEDERRLAYVAVTRAAKNLRIVCPAVVGGKSAGTSQFVLEAGLKNGENIARAGTPEAAEEEAEILDTSNKTASELGDGWLDEALAEHIAAQGASPWKPEDFQ